MKFLQDWLSLSIILQFSADTLQPLGAGDMAGHMQHDAQAIAVFSRRSKANQNTDLWQKCMLLSDSQGLRSGLPDILCYCVY